MIGKTIAATQDLGYSGFRLHFTDGTAADFHPTGWEADGVEVEQLDAAARRKRALKEAGERERERLRRLQNQARAAEARRLKATMTPEEFHQWEVKTYGHLHLAMRQMFRDSVLMFAEDANRTVIGQTASIPVKKSKARRS